MSWRAGRRLLALKRHLAPGRRNLSSSSGVRIADPVGEGDRAALVTRTREVLRRVVDLVPDFNGRHRRTLRTAQRNVDELFLISFVGEFNSGKSSLVNKLLGDNLAEVGATPTTAKVTVFQDVDSVKWTDDPELSQVADGTGRAVAPVIRAVDGIPWLRNVRIVDTPGMNAIMREHARLTLDFLPRSDLVVFLTSADRPFTESERRFLLNIKEWGKKLLFVVNKIDILPETEVEAVTDFVRSSAREVTGGEVPRVFAISTKPRKGSDPDPGFVEFENFLVSFLSSPERLLLKLQAAGGVAARALADFRSVAEERASVAAEDARALTASFQELDAWHVDVRADLDAQISSLDNTLLRFSARGDEWLDDSLRLGNVFSLLREQDLRDGFEREVVKGYAEELDARVAQVVSWLAEKSARQSILTVEQLRERVAALKRRGNESDGSSGRAIGDGESTAASAAGTRSTVEHDLIRAVDPYAAVRADPWLLDNRQVVVDSCRSEMQGVMSEHGDTERQVRDLASSLRTALLGAASLEAGALGVGSLVAASMLDWSGVAFAGALGISGLWVLPLQKAVLRRRFKEQVQRLRDEMRVAVEKHATGALDTSVQRIRDSVQPYSNFAKAEALRSQELAQRVAAIEAERKDLSAAVRKGLPF